MDIEVGDYVFCEYFNCTLVGRVEHLGPPSLEQLATIYFSNELFDYDIWEVRKLQLIPNPTLVELLYF